MVQIDGKYLEENRGTLSEFGFISNIHINFHNYDYPRKYSLELEFPQLIGQGDAFFEINSDMFQSLDDLRSILESAFPKLSDQLLDDFIDKCSTMIPSYASFIVALP